MTPGEIFWLAPILPLAAFLALALGRGWLDRYAAWTATAAVAASVIISGLALWAAASG